MKTLPSITAVSAIPALLVAACIASTAAVAAQPVWRCGAEGRSYSDVPCAEGRVVATADARPPAADVQAARDVLARDRALLHELVQERHERERAAQSAGTGLTGIKPAADVKPAATPAPLAAAHKRAQKLKRPFVARGTSPAIVQASR